MLPMICVQILVASAFLAGWVSIAHSQGNRITVELEGITFDSNYENGSLGSMESTAANRFRGRLFVESGELGDRSYWFRFRMRRHGCVPIRINGRRFSA